MKRYYVAAFISVMVILGTSISAEADQKSSDVAKLMNITGENITSVEPYTNSIDIFLQQFLKAHPALSDESIQVLRRSIEKHEMDFFKLMLDKGAARYYTDLTDNQIQQLISFFKSAPGEAFWRERQIILAESRVTAAMQAPILAGQIKADLATALQSNTSRSQSKTP